MRPYPRLVSATEGETRGDRLGRCLAAMEQRPTYEFAPHAANVMGGEF